MDSSVAPPGSMVEGAFQVVRISPHPLNANVMPDSLRHKLTNNIKESGLYPPIIVRSLESSVGFAGENFADKLQILDGHQRFGILQSLGYRMVRCQVWAGIDDDQALQYLATLNQLRGKDDPNKRATLLDCLRRRFADDLSQVARYVPETIRELQVRTQAVTTGPAARRVIDSADDKSSEKFDTFYCLLDDDMKKVVDGALRIRREMGNLPGEPMAPDTGQNLRQDYDRGRALADICAQWVIGRTGS